MNESNISRRKMEKEFVLFLNEDNVLKELEAAAVDHEKIVNDLPTEKKFPPPFRFQFKLNLDKIKEISEKLYLLFVKEPAAALDMARDVIFCTVLLIISNASLEKSDIQIIPIIINLPVRNEISHFLNSPSYQMQSLRGMLISKTTAAKYVCETKFCPRNKWQRYSEKMSNVCPNCYGSMEENVSSTDAGEEISCQFVSLKAYQSVGRFQSLSVKFKDELCSATDFQLGEEYIITGRLNEKVFEAMNVQPVGLEPQNYDNLPETIAKLQFEVSLRQANCSWSFVIALSSLLGAHIIPLSSFLNLKRGLLLSLATAESDYPVPLVAFGSDSLNVQNLFQAAGKFAERYIRHSVAHSYLGGVIKPGSQSDVQCQEAGQLILAAKGICNLGDWSKLKKEQANYICQTVESGQIVFNKGELGKTNSLSFVPLKCAVWTYSSNLGRSQNHHLQLKTLINVFGVPFLGEEKNERELTKICWKNLNATAKSLNETENFKNVTLQDFKKFFKVINSREVVLSEAASQLIRSYFVVSRRDRPHCLPLGAIKTITSLAEAHARLALRTEVLYEDAVAVIYLYEEAISSFYGESLIPCSKLAWNEKEPIYVWVSEQMRQFSVWLREYVSI